MARILIVDDDASSLMALSSVLANEIVTDVVTCKTPSTALEHLRDSVFDVVVSDIKMQQMDGFALLKTVRDTGNNVPFIFMTFHDDKQFTLDAFRMGAFDFISKPIDTVYLSASILRAIKHRKTLAELEKSQSENIARATQLERLAQLRADIGAALVSGETLPAILQKCVEGLVKHLGAAFARIWTLEDSSQFLILRASAGLYTHLDGAHGKVKVGDFKIGRIALNKRSHLSNTVLTDPEVGDKAWAQREGMVAFAGYPLLLEDKVFGVLALFSRTVLSPQVLRELELIADGITQWIKRKQVEEKLEERNDWLQVTLRSIGQAVIATDASARILFMNPIAEALTGCNAGGALEQSISSVFHALDESTRHTIENPIEKVLRENKTMALQNQTVLVSKSLKEIPIEACAAPIFSKAGSTIGAVMVFSDVTERRDNETLLRRSRDELEIRVAERTAELREREENFRILVEGVTDYAIVRLSAKGFVEDWNSGAVRITGYTKDSIHGCDFSVFFTVEDRSRSRHVLDLKEAIQNGHSVSEGARVRNDGSTFWAHVTISALRDDQCSVRGFAMVIRDITEFKKNETERQLLWDELSRKNKELESIVYVTSHDLRSPLVNIQGYSRELERACLGVAQLLSDSSGGAPDQGVLQPILRTEIPKYVRFITAGAEKMNALLKGLLTMSRLDRQSLNIELLDVDRLVNKIIDGMHYQVEANKAIISLGRLGNCMGDALQINQVFTNLIDNALKYRAPDRSLEISISVATRSESEIVFCVSDTGIGIHPDYQQKIFEIFQRLNPKGDIPGEGLGLSLVQRIISRHGGRCWVESQVDQGAKFFVALPVHGQDRKPSKVSVLSI